jgi:SAM-dependent methyltransferase
LEESAVSLLLAFTDSTFSISMNEKMNDMPRTLHLGCGNAKRDGAVGLDCRQFPGVDVVHDLEKGPLPFPDDSFENIVAEDVLEHIFNLVQLLEEIHRVAKKDALVEIRVPYLSGLSFAHDPTHIRGFTTRSFEYFIKGAPFRERYGYSTAVFQMQSMFFSVWSNGTILFKLFRQFANRWPEKYEKYFRYIFPMDNLHILLKVVKE